MEKLSTFRELVKTLTQAELLEKKEELEKELGRMMFNSDLITLTSKLEIIAELIDNG